MGKVSTTIQVVDKASKRLNNIYKALNRVNKAFDNLGSKSGIDQVVKRTEKVKRGMDAAVKSTQKMNTALNQGAVAADNVATGVAQIGKAAKSGYQPVNLLMGKLRRLASIYLGVLGTKAIGSTADTLTSSKIRFESIGANPQTTSNKIFNAAQASFTDYVEMMANVGKSLTLASSAFGSNLNEQVDNAIKFQEIMAKTYALSGASQAEQSSSMYQLIQALNSGNLQGDELRSVREGAPMAAKAIEKYAQAIYGTTDSLKEMGSQGLISSRMVVEAILAMDRETEAAFSRVRENMTFAQAFTELKNNTIRAFSEFLNTSTRIANSESTMALMRGLTKVIYGVGNTLNWAANVAGNAANFIYEHWSIIGPLFYALISAVTTFALVTLGQSLVTAVAAAVQSMIALAAGATSTQAAFGGVIAFVALTVYYFSALGLSAQTLAQYFGILSGVLIVAAAVSMVTGVAFLGMTAPMLLVLAGVLALAATFTAFPDVVGGSVGVILGIITNFGIFIYNIFANIANFLHNVFRTPVASVIALFGDMAANVLDILYSMVSGIEKVINLIPGVKVDITSGLGGVINSYKSAVQSVKDKSGWETLIETKDFIDLSQAYSKGASVGTNMHTGISNFGSNLLGDFASLFDSTPPSEIAQIYPLISDIGSSLGGIEDNTGKTAKNTQLTNDDLKWLRDVAEREAINKWTAAQIHIDMNNNNNVHNINDLDGIAIGLRGILLEELSDMANGWHNA